MACSAFFSATLLSSPRAVTKWSTNSRSRSRWRGSPPSPQKTEIAALVGAENLLGEELGIAALRNLRRVRGHTRAPLQLGVVEQKLDAPPLYRQPDAVAVAHEPERPA